MHTTSKPPGVWGEQKYASAFGRRTSYVPVGWGVAWSCVEQASIVHRQRKSAGETLSTETNSTAVSRCDICGVGVVFQQRRREQRIKCTGQQKSAPYFHDPSVRCGRVGKTIN